MRLHTLVPTQGDGETASRNPVGNARLATVSNNPIMYKNTRPRRAKTNTALDLVLFRVRRDRS